MRFLLFILFLYFSGYIFSQEGSSILPKNNTHFLVSPKYFEWNQIGTNNEYILSISQDSLFSLGQTSTISTMNTYLNFQDTITSGKWYWRIDAINAPADYVSVINNFEIVDFSSSSSLKLWLVPDSINCTPANGPLSSWLDISNQSNNLFQNTATRKPILEDNVINNLPAVYFDGNDRFDSPNMQLSNAEFFFVCRGENNTNKFFGF